MENNSTPEMPFPFAWPSKWMHETWDYSLDALQRSFLFLDVLAQRTARYRAQEARNVPNVLRVRGEKELPKGRL
jgi:hypothetical protein